MKIRRFSFSKGQTKCFHSGAFREINLMALSKFTFSDMRLAAHQPERFVIESIILYDSVTYFFATIFPYQIQPLSFD